MPGHHLSHPCFSGRSVLALVAVLGCVAALATGTGIARGGGDPSEDPAAQRERVKATSPELPDLVRAFQRDQVDEDRIPGDPLGDLAQTGTLQPQEDPRLSRRVHDGERPAYVWPARDRACYAYRNMGGCVHTSVLRRHGVAVSATYTSSDPTAHLFGLVAPGVRDVKLHLADGSAVDVDVRNDAFAVAVSRDPARATWTNNDGSAGRQEPLVVRSAE